MAGHIDTCIQTAYSQRRPLIESGTVDAYRLFNGRADGIAGLVIERFSDVLVVQLNEGQLLSNVNEIRSAVENIHRQLGTRAVYKKTFVRDRSHLADNIDRAHREAKPWIGEPVEPERVVIENDLRFIIRPYDGFSVGLFLEHRDNRRLIRKLAGGLRVLNAFCYTCSFSMAAAAGGAASVSSVDLSKRYLDWGKRNFDANCIDQSGHLFFCADIFDFFKRVRRQKRRYDLIILDPPTFSRSRRPDRAFVLAEQLGRLCTEAVQLLDPGGLIFLSTNHRRISRSRLEEELMTSAQSMQRTCTITERPALPLDFANDPGYSKSIIARID